MDKMMQPLPPNPYEYENREDESGVAPWAASAGKSRRRWPAILGVAVVSAVVASAVTFAGVSTVGGLDSGSVAQNAPIVRPAVVGGSADVVEVAAATRPAIIHVRVAGERGQGSGSGVIYDESGYALTNNHVVEGAREISVELADGRVVDADLVGRDPRTDIAVLKLDATGLPTASLGTASDLQIGEPAIAIGNPLGLEGGPTVTAGVISALGRDVQTERGGAALVDMIQTDASISPGSSGGALIDADGTVIGITTAIAVSEVGATDIGYAVPIDVAEKVALDITEDGEAQHPYLGIRGADAVDDSGARVGARIASVEPGGPAELAGIRAGDVITELDGNAVDSMSALVVALRTKQPGDTVELRVVRDGGASTVEIELGRQA